MILTVVMYTVFVAMTDDLNRRLRMNTANTVVVLYCNTVIIATRPPHAMLFCLYVCISLTADDGPQRVRLLIPPTAAALPY